MPGKQAKVITPPMLKRMVRHVSRAASFPERDRAMILLSVKAGMRACEIAGLDWSMVLDARGRVSDALDCLSVRDAPTQYRQKLQVRRKVMAESRSQRALGECIACTLSSACLPASPSDNARDRRAVLQGEQFLRRTRQSRPGYAHAHAQC
jgi:hypothetical protein